MCAVPEPVWLCPISGVGLVHKKQMRDTLLAVVLSKSATHVTIDLSSALPLRNTLHHTHPAQQLLAAHFKVLWFFSQNCAQFIKMAVENTVGHSSGGRSRVCLLLHTCGPHVRVRSEKLSIVKVTLHWTTHGEWRSVAIILQRSSSMYEEGTLHTN